MPGTDGECSCMNGSHSYARYSDTTGNYNCVRPRGSTHFLVLMSLAGKLVLGIIMQSILIEGKRIELKLNGLASEKNVLPVECTHAIHVENSVAMARFTRRNYLRN